MGMEALTRWIERETKPGAGVLRVFAWVAVGLFLFVFGAAGVQSFWETPPPEAWGAVSLFFVIMVVLGVASLRMKPPAKRDVSLDPLATAVWQGKLAEALGESAGLLGQAAADLEQAEALLGFTSLDPAFSDSVRLAGNGRMRRMVELTIAAPGRFGLTVEQARAQVAADGAWLAEVRRLVEASRSSSEVFPREDETLGHLKALVQAREEAVVELRG